MQPAAMEGVDGKPAGRLPLCVFAKPPRSGARGAMKPESGWNEFVANYTSTSVARQAPVGMDETPQILRPSTN